MNQTNPGRDSARMRFRKLRIAWSVAWGVACLLLIVLWVRSYRQVDTLDNLYGYRIDAKQGKLVLGERVQPPSITAN